MGKDVYKRKRALGVEVKRIMGKLHLLGILDSFVDSRRTVFHCSVIPKGPALSQNLAV